MARLSFSARRVATALERWLPDSLFGRLALLLFVVALLSHVLALSLLFELRPPHPPPPWGLDATPPHPPGPPPPGLGMLLDIGVRLGALLLAAWVGARWLSAPMRRLADAAQGLGANIHCPPLIEAGTRECREATRVMNQMQQHIRAQLDERDQFVAAVSHDLRTPLTRLALRAESLPSDRDRQRFGKDIAEMDTMSRSTLDYLRGAADPEPWVALDLGALVSSLVHDCQECGEPVVLVALPEGGDYPVRVRAQASALRRCISNLMDNAVRYGGGAELELAVHGDAVCLKVNDCGPGIPDDALTQVLLPFFRLESSRNRHTGGVGLGLAIASDTARRHGGDLVLRNRLQPQGGGLQAELTLARIPAKH